MLVLASFVISLQAAPVTSTLKGESGERSDLTGRLPDFSFAGYHRGEVALPELPQAANVKDFGAIGDGVADDTKAIQSAIDAVTRGAVFLPKGRYKITNVIRVTKSGVVLRGAGAQESVLWFPLGLDEIHPGSGKTSTGEPASPHSFDGAFVTIEGNYRQTPLAKIIAVAHRGDRAVKVDHPGSLAMGQSVLVVVHETKDQSLKRFLYSDDPGDISHGKPFDAKILVRITAVHGDEVVFDRALRFETRAEWQPEICAFAPTVTESGVENLGFVFPAKRYRGHFAENGANAIELRNVFSCWIRDVMIRNADLGINVVACGNTIDGVTITADSNRGNFARSATGWFGHHAIQLKHAEDNLVSRFDLRTTFVHDLSVEHASGNVFAHGRGDDLALDHHKDTPFENLYSDIDCGRGTRVWFSGGGDGLGRHCAGYETFWNVRAAIPIALPPAGWGVRTMNLIGAFAPARDSSKSEGPFVENVSGNVQPTDLHAAQLAQRTKSKDAKAEVGLTKYSPR